jgi:hypothetical protein
MTGGLIQIVAYGTEDLFLTAKPQITFFKVVYRRYTNFAIESTEEYFNGAVDFGETVSCQISKNGDLLHKMYLKVNIPRVSLYKQNDEDKVDNSLIEYNDANEKFKYFDLYSKYLIDCYKIILDLLIPQSTTYIDIYTACLKYFSTELLIEGTDYYYTNIKDYIDGKILTKTDLLSEITLIYNRTDLTDSEKKVEMKEMNEKIYKELISVHKRYYYKKEEAIEEYNNIILEKANFSWIKRLGHFIIENIEIDIGGSIIDKHYNDWINIWYELTKNDEMKETYNKMIGDIKILTNYDKNVKPSYTLFIPLNFWFCRFNGSALPLVALRYHEVKINVTFSKLNQCCYTDYDNRNNDLIDKINLNNASLYIDYIYLDNDERKKFAQSTHEYLIHNIQRNYVNINKVKNYTFDMNLTNPITELCWIIQSNDLYNKKMLKNNYSSSKEIIENSKHYKIIQEGNPLDSASIELNGVKRMMEQSGNYYNYVQPYQSHSSTPSDGINVYSFSLNPEEYQPYGSCNFSKLKNTKINMNLNKKFIDNLSEDDILLIKLFAVSYNILRFKGGMAGLAFSV